MEHMEMLKKTLCKEIDEMAERIGQKKMLAGNELEQISKLVMTLKNIYKVEKLEAESAHSMGRGMWNARGGYSNGMDESYRYGHTYDGEHSERRGRDARGRYTSMYSMNDSKYEMVEGIREMMDREGLSPQSREILHKAMEQLSK